MLLVIVLFFCGFTWLCDFVYDVGFAFVMLICIVKLYC